VTGFVRNWVYSQDVTPARSDTTSIGVPLPVDLVGRKGKLAEIHRLLAPGGSEGPFGAEAAGRTISLYGMGGVGKSALAVRYCHEFRADYSLIWWVNAESPTTVSGSYEEYLHHFPELKAQIPRGDDVRPYVDIHLSRQAIALVVYDNLADEVTMRDIRPPSFLGAVLITSRNSDGWEYPVRVELLSLTAARDWLIHAAGKSPQCGGDLAAVDPGVIDDAEWLAGEEATRGLALALKMAVNYIRNTRCGLAEYRRLYLATNNTVLDSQDHAPADYRKTVYFAFAITLRSLVADNRHESIQLIEIAAFYAPDDIPTRIFTPQVLKSTRPDAAHYALGALSALGLVELSEGSFSVHRVVQEVVRYYLLHDFPDIDVAMAKASKRRCTFLILTAQAPAADNLDAGRTAKEIEDLLRSSPLRDQIEVRSRPEATPQDLVRALRNYAPEVVTFVAHGTAAGIDLRDDDSDSVSTASPFELANAFQGRGVQVVVLGACHSAATAEALAVHVPVVVGTRGEPKADATRRYVTEFNFGLAKGLTSSQAHRDSVAVVGLSDGLNVFELHGRDAELAIFR